MQSYRKTAIVYLALFSAGAFFAMHYALVHLSATKVAVSANSIPIITLFAEVLLMGGSLTFFKVLGTLATIAGVVLTQLDKVNLKTVVEGIEEG